MSYLVLFSTLTTASSANSCMPLKFSSVDLPLMNIGNNSGNIVVNSNCCDETRGQIYFIFSNDLDCY